jgi:hypothetical protein
MATIENINLNNVQEQLVSQVNIKSINGFSILGSGDLILSVLALGETSSNAYRGDRGKTAYDHSQVVTGNPHQVTKSQV